MRVALLAVTVFTVLGFIAFSPSADAVSDKSKPNTAVVVMQEGQTLWNLATKSQPDRDPRDVVSDIYALNNLESGSQIYVGQVLYIPVSN